MSERNESAARRCRRDRHHYLLGYLAGRVAGLMEAVELASVSLTRGSAAANIRARIAEIEEEAKTP